MNLKEYINRSLPNLNWNILPQIFEENEVELTEEIRAYLKETPGNTNWNVLRGLQKDDGNIFLSLMISGGTSGDDGEGIYSSIWTNTVDNSTIEKINGLTNGKYITVLINDKEWFTTAISTIDSIITVGQTQNVIISGREAQDPYNLPEYFSQNGTIKIILNEVTR